MNEHKEVCSDYERALAEHLETIHDQTSIIGEHKGVISSGANEIRNNLFLSQNKITFTHF